MQVFAQVKRPTPTSKIHKHREISQGRYYDTEAQPQCGAKGSYDYIKATEAMDSELCVRCFGRPAGCSYLCGKTNTSSHTEQRRKAFHQKSKLRRKNHQVIHRVNMCKHECV